jgi:hypothetical protein
VLADPDESNFAHGDTGNSNPSATSDEANPAELPDRPCADRNDAAFEKAASLRNETARAWPLLREMRMPVRPLPSLAALTASILAIPAIAMATPADEPVAAPPADPEKGADRDTDVADSRDRVAYGGPGSYAPEPVVAVPPPAAAADGLVGHRDRDAASGRGYLGPTALTAPRGKVTLNWYSPIAPVVGAATIGFGVTDRVQLSVGTTFESEGGYDDCYDCYGGNDDNGGIFVAKVQLLKRARTAIAAQVSFISIDDESAQAYTAVVSQCVDGDRCNTVLSGHITMVPDGDAYDDNGNQATALHGVLGGSLVTGGGRLKFVLDGAMFGEDEDEKLLVTYGGLRYAGRRFSADLGMVVLLDEGDAEGIPLPLIALGGRL